MFPPNIFPSACLHTFSCVPVLLDVSYMLAMRIIWPPEQVVIIEIHQSLPGVVVHGCNLSDLGGRGRRIASLRPASAS